MFRRRMLPLSSWSNILGHITKSSIFWDMSQYIPFFKAHYVSEENVTSIFMVE
jgi:hypothetical protein